MATFKAFRVHTIDGKSVCRFEQLALEDLDPGPVVIQTAYSAITYKDAMAARGVGKNVRTDRPCVTGIDLAGVVVASADSRFTEGDRVIVTKRHAFIQFLCNLHRLFNRKAELVIGRLLQGAGHKGWQWIFEALFIGN